MSMMFGNGDGTFQAPVTRPSSYSHTFGNVRDIVAGDADGDGDLDLMAGNWARWTSRTSRTAAPGASPPRYARARAGTRWTSCSGTSTATGGETS